MKKQKTKKPQKKAVKRTAKSKEVTPQAHLEGKIGTLDAIILTVLSVALVLGALRLIGL